MESLPELKKDNEKQTESERDSRTAPSGPERTRGN